MIDRQGKSADEQIPLLEHGGKQELRLLPNQTLAYRITKRFLDLLITLLAFLALWPVVLLTAIAIKLEAPAGRVIYSQMRVGLNGKPFRMYKFRSMYSNADSLKPSLMLRNEMDGPVFKIKNDPRITKVGKFIRKSSIDELPQFVNILKGEMTLVGPRPQLLEEARTLSDYHKQRQLVKPGLTCIWQVSGRNDISFLKWMDMDIEYIHKQGTWTDLTIMLKTIPAVLLSRGAS